MAEASAVPGLSMPFSRKVDKEFKSKREELAAKRKAKAEDSDSDESSSSSSSGSSSSGSDSDSSSGSSYSSDSENSMSDGSGSYYSARGSARSSARSSGSKRSSARGTARSTARSKKSTGRTGRSTARSRRSGGSSTARSRLSSSSRRSRRSHGGSRIYAADDEFDNSMYGKFQRWRARKAAERRHPTLVYFEELELQMAEVEEMRLLNEDRARIRKRRTNLEREVQLQRQENFYRIVREEDMKRFKAEVENRTKESQRYKTTMTLLETWALEADKKQANLESGADAQLAKAREAERIEQAKARNEGEQQAQVAQRLADEHETQQILAIMRRSGTIAGVNAPVPEEEEVQRETAKVVVLRNRPAEEIRNAKKGRAFTHFTVDVRRFKNAESVKGEKIGVDGCVFLAKMFQQGACPRMLSLNLGWNIIKKIGCDRLLYVFHKQGPAVILENLDLRANHIPPSSVELLCRGLDQGSLPCLSVLDLRQNTIGDDGALALSRSLLNGSLRNLKRLHVQHNQIGDVGISALFRVFIGETVVCPLIENVGCRFNDARPQLVRSLSPCPVFFQV